MKPAQRQRQSGFILLEFIVGLVLLGLAIVLMGQYLSDSARRSQETVAATQMRQLVDAAERYIADNNVALRAAATASTPATVTVAALQTAKYLPPSFAASNVYMQAYEIRVLEPSAGILSTLVVTTGGDTIGESSLRRIARQVGTVGGFVSTTATTVATGAYGGWNQALATYGAANGGGRLAAALFFRDGQQVTDFLYRAALPGHPEVNTMAAPLDMGYNNIVNVGNITTGGQLTADSIIVARTVIVNTTCTPNGLLGKQPDGRIASCVNGLWRLAGT